MKKINTNQHVIVSIFQEYIVQYVLYIEFMIKKSFCYKTH